MSTLSEDPRIPLPSDIRPYDILVLRDGTQIVHGCSGSVAHRHRPDGRWCGLYEDCFIPHKWDVIGIIRVPATPQPQPPLGLFNKYRIKELEDLMPGAAWFIRRCIPVYQPPERRPLAEIMAKRIEYSISGLACDPPLLAIMEAEAEEIKSNKATVGHLEELVLKATEFSRCEALPEQHPCEECNIRGLQLYYRRTCHEVDEGEYLCLRCIVKRWADFREECASSGHE